MPKSVENKRFAIDFSISLFFLAIMWMIKIYEVSFNVSLSHYGIYPRHLEGLWGIIFAPLLHGSWSHLYTNSFPFLILLTALLFLHPKNGMKTFWIIWFAGNVIVWIIGREAYHIGASGLISGMFAFLLFYGIISRSRQDLAISLIVIFLYGGVIWGILPQNTNISWEAHLGGFVTGTLLSLKYAPKPQIYNKKKRVFTQWQYNFENFDTFNFKTNFYYIYTENLKNENNCRIKKNWDYSADNSGIYEFESPKFTFRQI